MAKTYKGWTRNDPIFGEWTKEDYLPIQDRAAKTKRGLIKLSKIRYCVEFIPGGSLDNRHVTKEFKKLSDAIFYVETGKYRWDV